MEVKINIVIPEDIQMKRDIMLGYVKLSQEIAEMNQAYDVNLNFEVISRGNDVLTIKE